MTPAIIGVDPGGVETGIVLRRGDELLWHATIVERDPQAHVNAITRALHHGFLTVGLDVTVAVEDVTEPNPHMGLTNVKGLIGTARILGAVMGFYPCTILVPPGRNGSGPLSAYPLALRPTRGSGRGRDGLRHVRSAWDVAGAAAVLLRQRRAG